jgi:hypothetical protein
MLTQLDEILKARAPHPWLHKVHITPITPQINPIITRISDALLERSRHHGHET